MAWIERSRDERAEPGAPSAIRRRGPAPGTAGENRAGNTAAGETRASRTFLVRFATSRDPKNRAARKFTICREQQRAFGTRGAQPPSACDTHGITAGSDRCQGEFVLTSKSLDARQRDSHD